MIQAVTPTRPPFPPLPATGVSNGAGAAFALTVAGVGDATGDDPADTGPADNDRQKDRQKDRQDAVPAGNVLPVAPPHLLPDPLPAQLIAWIPPIASPPPPPAAPAGIARTDRPGLPPRIGEPIAGPAIISTVTPTAPAATPPSLPPTDTVVSAPLAPMQQDAAAQVSDRGPVAPTAREKAMVARLDPPAVTPAAPPVTGTTAPAFQVFGAMRAAAARDERADEMLAIAAPAATAPVAPHRTVEAAGDAQQPPLDMSNGRWPHAMIDRIEQLHDAADAADTRIRLVPDALGSIDVAVKRDGDMIHLHFTAEQATTRALIHDAQPRLAAIAQERGLTLGESAVDTGGRGRDPQRQPLPPRTAPPCPAAAPTAADDAAPGGRLA